MTDDTNQQDLPEAFTSPDPAEEDASGRIGAGRVIDGEPSQERGETDDNQVEEASRESFPGSDPTPFRGNPQD